MVSTRSSTRAESIEVEPVPDTPTRQTRRSTRKSNPIAKHWAHTPSHLVLVWITFSVPLVLWDICYVLGRPHTMPGGKWHSPIWKPYAKYVEVDGIYGWKAFNEKLGFTAAQTVINIFETLAYLVYMWLVIKYGEETKKKGRGVPAGNIWTNSWWGRARQMHGREAAIACIIAFSGAMNTFAKTVLYALNEHFSGYAYTGHNDLQTLIFFYYIPNGLWIVFPAYMVYVFGVEMVEGLAIAGGDDPRDSKILAIKDD